LVSATLAKLAGTGVYLHQRLPDADLAADLIENDCGLNAHCESCYRHAPVNLYCLAQQYGREATFVKSESPIRLPSYLPHEIKDESYKNASCQEH
jgi:hypothetical protein